jgi:hypothetical protein
MPTSESANPNAQTISVAEGSNETILGARVVTVPTVGRKGRPSGAFRLDVTVPITT